MPETTVRPTCLDPDWCTCEPESADRCEYRILADAVIEHLNPPDDDEAEVAICCTAIEEVAAFVASLPCACVPGGEPAECCERCRVLGRWRDKPREAWMVDTEGQWACPLIKEAPDAR
jgi:hypothetical protein